MTQELLPCPFCGGEAKLDRAEHGEYDKFTYSVYCDNCHNQTKWFHDYEENAVEKWNTRTPTEGKQ